MDNNIEEQQQRQRDIFERLGSGLGRGMDRFGNRFQRAPRPNMVLRPNTLITLTPKGKTKFEAGAFTGAKHNIAEYLIEQKAATVNEISTEACYDDYASARITIQQLISSGDLQSRIGEI